MPENNICSYLDRFVGITRLPKNVSVVYMHAHELVFNSDVSAHL